MQMFGFSSPVGEESPFSMTFLFAWIVVSIGEGARALRRGSELAEGCQTRGDDLPRTPGVFERFLSCEGTTGREASLCSRFSFFFVFFWRDLR
jgi:hypothetical protein